MSGVDKDYYEILGVKPTASEKEIQSAYRKLVSRYHPDKHQDNALRELAEEKLQELNEAYEILSDPQRRANYDRKPARAFSPGGGHTNAPSTTLRIQRFLNWALIVIGTPILVRFVRNPKVSAAIIMAAVLWFLWRWRKPRP